MAMILGRFQRHVVNVARPLTAQARFSSGIKILEDSGKARENLYWAHEDEKLLKKMIENNPDLDPALAGIKSLMADNEHASVTDKVKLIFVKHGIPPANKALISDLVDLVEGK
mmetsp:Transcript_122604/g.381672  ORF Transcript_122604/g.381672 Transcript_122604/m.381672 type:complete len:113 (+) Transcript_122604:135-473(+)|eukprot:CAMPEP_0204532032 /NCGR_PEP_ID=MMETSP0661-20131031/11501_1 /ASSEMBLY_ACC=CAM_ASM_000606 /TAXON_ID=109239 /ORGANISM="Alexandrium margalefi, Strain AMGDE01CS-322" /LENGTH=112 /DNA_ID=CAMNT_0051538237 /DNA_START=102 /DNA_END=440 /DNA_ORIENTATION=-